jgi:hypothetical protein
MLMRIIGRPGATIIESRQEIFSAPDIVLQVLALNAIRPPAYRI